MSEPAVPAGAPESGARAAVLHACALLLPAFCLLEVNWPVLKPQSELAIFAALGVAMIFLGGAGPAPAGVAAPGRRRLGRLLGAAAALGFAAVCIYVVVQTEPLFARWWPGGQSLGDRAGAETALDLAAGTLGLVLILIAARRSLGWSLPLLSLAFLAYARWGAVLPDWLLPHRGYGWERTVAQTFLHGQGVFGVALNVMFTYVFPFLVFGALLQACGATGYILDASNRLLGRSRGGPAKVAVVASGLMGSLNGSAVANTATTGTFTIPMMRAAGFRPETAAGLEAAASSGGALVPPVMGAGAYMMLEIIDPPVTYLQIVKAAILPAVLYYLSLYLIVHFRAHRLADRGRLPTAPDVPETGSAPAAPAAPARLLRWEGAVFLTALAVLITLLLLRYSVPRAVTWSMAAAVALATVNPRTRLTPRSAARALAASSRGGVALIAAAAAVGVVLGVVTLTGAGSALPALLLPLAEDHLLLALLALMASSLVLGMGLPSAVCYLLLATLVGPVLGQLGVVPLAAHMFIFYFGMMSMVTPPVALAAYAASSIAGSRIWTSSVAAFRFALIGFALPFLFVYRPELLMLAPDGGAAGAGAVIAAAAQVALGTVPLAAAAAGWLGRPLGAGARVVLFAAAALALVPAGPALGGVPFTAVNLAGLALTGAVWLGGRWKAGPGDGAAHAGTGAGS